jgi:hypothetical protein
MPRVTDVSDESSSDDEQSELLFRYRQLGMRESSRHTTNIFQLAIQELEGCFSHLYTSKHATRELRTLLFSDALAMVEAAFCCSRRQCHPLHSAVTSMVRAAAKVLPQQRSKELPSLLKKKQIEHARRSKQASSAEDTENNAENDSLDHTSLLDLPSDCLGIILAHLDPISLASLEATCPKMHQASPLFEDAWRRHVIGVSRTDQASGIEGRWGSQFKIMAVGNSEILSQWKYRRVLVGGRPKWAVPEEDLGLEIDTVEWCLSGKRKGPRLKQHFDDDGSSCEEDDSEPRTKMKMWNVHRHLGTRT